jgi:NADPH2:quinone reductase
MSIRHTTRLFNSNLRPTTQLARLTQLTSQIRAENRAMATSIPKTMKGVQISKTGGTEVLEYKTDLPVPVPKEGEVLVKNEFIGINYIDTYFYLLFYMSSILSPISSNLYKLTLPSNSYFRTGLYPSPLPLILGREGEGEVISVGPGGELTGLKKGDRVVWMGTDAYAEYTATSAAKAYAIPSALAPSLASAALLQGLTALTLIREAYHVQKGDWVLVHAAAGGVGLWLVQLLKAVGAKTIGTASTAEKIELAKENGANFMVNYKEEKDFVGKIKEITGGEGVRAVFDSTGKDQFDNDLEVVARNGTVVSYGNSVSHSVSLFRPHL